MSRFYRKNQTMELNAVTCLYIYMFAAMMYCGLQVLSIYVSILVLLHFRNVCIRLDIHYAELFG